MFNVLVSDSVEGDNTSTQMTEQQPSDPLDPQNGIKNSASAALLQRELDLLNLLDANQTSSDQIEPDSSGQQEADEMECAESDDVVIVDDNSWTLLDCHFGVPLFDAKINKNVCDKILLNSLCSKER